MADFIRPCSVADCERAVYGYGYCKLHMRRWQKHGDTDTVRAPRLPKPKVQCSAPACVQNARNAGLCASHYRNRRAGKDLAPRNNLPPSLPNEVWVGVVGASGDYQVSNQGRVRSMPRIDRSGRQIRGRIMALSTHPLGYRYVALVYNTGTRRRRPIHQLVAEAFIGPRPAGLHVCHNDGDPANNRPSNLRYDTPSENGYDTVRHGHHRGASATHCKRGHEFATYAVYEPNYNRRYCGRCRKLRERPH